MDNTGIQTEITHNIEELIGCERDIDYKTVHSSFCSVFNSMSNELKEERMETRKMHFLL